MHICKHERQAYVPSLTVRASTRARSTASFALNNRFSPSDTRAAAAIASPFATRSCSSAALSSRRGPGSGLRDRLMEKPVARTGRDSIRSASFPTPPFTNAATDGLHSVAPAYYKHDLSSCSAYRTHSVPPSFFSQRYTPCPCQTRVPPSGANFCAAPSLNLNSNPSMIRARSLAPSSPCPSYCRPCRSDGRQTGSPPPPGQPG